MLSYYICTDVHRSGLTISSMFEQLCPRRSSRLGSSCFTIDLSQFYHRDVINNCLYVKSNLLLSNVYSTPPPQKKKNLIKHYTWPSKLER